MSHPHVNDVCGCVYVSASERYISSVCYNDVKTMYIVTKVTDVESRRASHTVLIYKIEWFFFLRYIVANINACSQSSHQKISAQYAMMRYNLKKNVRYRFRLEGKQFSSSLTFFFINVQCLVLSTIIYISVSVNFIFSSLMS